MKRAFLFLMLWTIGAVAAPKAETSLLVDTLSLHIFDLSEQYDTGKPEAPVTIILDMQSLLTSKQQFNPALFVQLAKFKLDRMGIANRVFARNFREEFLAQKLPVGDLLGPKLIIDVNVAQNEGSLDYDLYLGVSFVEYLPDRTNSRGHRLQKAWSKVHHLTALSPQDLEESSARLLQKELDRFLSMHRATPLLQARSASLMEASFPAPVPSETAKLRYNLNWRDDESRSHLLAVGGTGGIPLLANIHLGYWGPIDLPIQVGFSGIYISEDRRGFHLDAGWVFDRTGYFKQVIGLAAGRWNETHVETTEITEGRGRTATRQETFHRLRTSLGPVYTAQYKAFRFQFGVMFPVGVEPRELGTRFLFQVGYVPLFPF